MSLFGNRPTSETDARHDDQAGVHTQWHDSHGGAYHHFTKKHKERVRRRLSSMGPIQEAPKISKRILLAVMFTEYLPPWPSG